MSENNQTTQNNGLRSSETNNYDPSSVDGASPAGNIKEFAGQIVVIKSAIIKEGKEYDGARLNVSNDNGSTYREVVSYSGHIVSAVKDMVNRSLFPVRCRVETKGTAIYFSRV